MNKRKKKMTITVHLLRKSSVDPNKVDLSNVDFRVVESLAPIFMQVKPCESIPSQGARSVHAGNYEGRLTIRTCLGTIPRGKSIYVQISHPTHSAKCGNHIFEKVGHDTWRRGHLYTTREGMLRALAAQSEREMLAVGVDGRKGHRPDATHHGSDLFHQQPHGDASR
jgi:hypothetical protein